MAKRRRNVEAFSLSFLDCICCGFGAIILLLVLSKIYEPVIIEKTQDDLESLIALLQQELFDIRGETTVINRELESVRSQTSTTKLKLARLQGELDTVRGQYAATQQDSEATLDEGALRATRQRLTEEMRRLQPYYRSAEDDAVAGIPVDSEYVIFIVDTSGSMQQFNWDRAIRKLTETLDVYPQVKGMQIMNDNGAYMFQQYAGKWIPDTPGRRQAIINTNIQLEDDQLEQLAGCNPDLDIGLIRTSIVCEASTTKKIPSSSEINYMLNRMRGTAPYFIYIPAFQSQNTFAYLKVYAP